MAKAGLVRRASGDRQLEELVAATLAVLAEAAVGPVRDRRAESTGTRSTAILYAPAMAERIPSSKARFVVFDPGVMPGDAVGARPVGGRAVRLAIRDAAEFARSIGKSIGA